MGPSRPAPYLMIVDETTSFNMFETINQKANVIVNIHHESILEVVMMQDIILTVGITV